MGRDKVDLFARIRDDNRQLGLGVRALARRHGVHRRMVRQALGSPVPAPRKRPARQSPVLDAAAGLIDAMLREDLDAPRKQRHTCRRIWQRLADEHHVTVSYSCVCRYAGRRRAEIEAEHRAGAGSVEGFVPQAKEPGAEAEADFGPVSIVVGGDQQACRLFAYRLSCSGRGVHRVYASCAQEAFLEGHVTAFEVTGGVPWRHIRYDNLSPAVTKVMTGRDRKETARWFSFRSWYGFAAFYCEPGLSGAHEKGGVEGEIGRYRRRYLVPVPRVKSLAELNARLAEDDIEDDRRHIEYRTATVADDFAAEQPALRPLPGDGFETGTVLWPRADKFARISVGKCRYSVPARLIGSRVRIKLTANELAAFEEARRAARVGALAQARAAGTFTPEHQRLWDAARARLGDGAGPGVLIEVLLLHRRLPAASVTAGITAALGAGTCSPDVVAVEARKHAGAAGARERAAVPGPAPRPSGASVITLPRRAAVLPDDGRPAPSVAVYDQLLDRPPA